ncbi:NB-ARC domain-containing protein [Vibrio campbellii]|uniref:NB-ARC domain-containing protein n=1 Tax=Vibrio campbellii TaxID=680 RepID=UPI00069409BE|nr:NB-ARC domain-containing protein [Vibrio campbellii]
MARFHSSQVCPPKHWQEFEELCADLWSVINDSKTQTHGRTGQKQDGVDIYGQIGQSGKWFGIQCKLKDTRTDNKLTEIELLSEVEKAKRFTPKLSEFIIATTTSNDAVIQKVARELTALHAKEDLFSVDVKSWDEIQRELSLCPEILVKHYPDYVGMEKKQLNDESWITRHMPAPRPKNAYFGRGSELKELVEALENESLIQICGVGGIGKSELLLQALKECESSKNTIWCNVEKYHSIDDIILAFINIFRQRDENITADNLPSYFDKENLRIVFDGVEQGSLDDLEDLLVDWHSHTSNCQIVITSQVELYQLQSSLLVNLKGLTIEQSKLFFKNLYRNEISDDDQSFNELIAFCDGHALTITLAVSLTKYYGSPRAAMDAINQFKTNVINIPGRSNHNRYTSLEICLQTAYEFLSSGSIKILWVLSELPAGIFSKVFEDNWLDIENSKDSYASLRRWQLIEEIENYNGIRRTRMLTPIRNFISSKAQNCKSNDYEKVMERLATTIQVWVAAIETKYSKQENHAFMMSRYEEELPNLVNIINLALNHDNQELTKVAGTLASCIMPYYFVLGAPEIGVRILRDVTRLTIKSGNVKKSNELFTQYVSLMKRIDRHELFEEARKLLVEIERMPGVESISGELNLSKAILSCNDDIKQGDDILAEKHSRNAIVVFEGKINILNESNNDFDYEHETLRQNLSYSYGTLGTSLLNQGKYEEALEAYYNCLHYQDESIKSTNEGQTVHQIGKCYLALENGEAAIKSFTYSTCLFLNNGMTDYISHSLGELGYSFLLVPIEKIENIFSEDDIELFLLDLMQYTKKNFDINCTSVKNTQAYNIKKLLGTFYLLSLIDFDYKLNSFTIELIETLHISFRESEGFSSSNKEKRIALYILNKVLELGHRISCVSNVNSNESLHSEVGKLLVLVCEVSTILNHKQFKLTEWMAIYLQKILDCKPIEPMRIERFIYNYNNDIPDTFDPYSD